jgi:5-methylcytosine-specific restriction endonuclease McrA
MALARPCLGCGKLIDRATGSRCPACKLHRTRGRRWQAIRRQVFARYGDVCVRCGEPATDVDHLTPIAVGGDDSLANLRPACARCNRGWH